MDNNRVIYLVWEYRAVAGPFASIEEIPDQIFEVVDEDVGYTLEVHRPDDIELDIRTKGWWES